MSTAAVASPKQGKVDNRNLEWRRSNVGSKLLQKMGWKDGEGVGKRQRTTEEKTNPTIKTFSSEGIRVQKRQDGLGLGAGSQLALSAQPQHVEHFSSVLASLQQEHGQNSSDSKKSKKRKKKTEKVLPTNKSTHAKVRAAKFQVKTDEEMKCIFAGVVSHQVVGAVSSNEERQRKRKKEKREKKEKKRSKKE